MQVSLQSLFFQVAVAMSHADALQVLRVSLQRRMHRVAADVCRRSDRMRNRIWKKDGSKRGGRPDRTLPGEGSSWT